ncbi:MAG: hypothetical protein ABR981_02930 [Candidatus Micrarchaeaceae archaeon]|jgi:hypothetical protein
MNSTITTARRAFGISKIYIVIAIVFTIIAITVWNPGIYQQINSKNSTVSNSLTNNTIALNSTSAGRNATQFSGISLIAVPLDIVPVLMIITPVILLFVYDKNNGVLEYFLSIGKTQKDIYMQYLKAALLLASVYLLIFVPADMIYTRLTYGAIPANNFTLIPLVVIPFAFAVVAFMTTCMMAFSTLQKTRAGSNQPLGLIIGWVSTAPGYLVAFVLSFTIGIYADLSIAAIIAAISLAMLISSDKLIKREKLLP